MLIKQIYTGCLAQGAYYVESEGEAVIIDPLRDTQTYVDIVQENGAQITHILETHFHADFVSGHVQLAAVTGASIVYGPMADPQFEFHQAVDGEEIPLGACKIRVIHTPGHTMESTCYLLIDPDGKPHAIFTGDTLFIGDVGRPDLAQKAEDITQEDLARHLYYSLRNKLMNLPGNVLVYPAHGAGSACGKNLSSQTWDTLGNQLATNYALRADMTEKEFIEEVTDGLLPPPPYFPKNVALNKENIASVSDVLKRALIGLQPAEFENAVENRQAIVLDTRTPKEFVEMHVPGSIFIGIDGNFAPWVGSLFADVQQPLALVCHEGREEEIITRLSRVGFDQTIGFLKGGVDAWKGEGKATDCIEQISAEEFARVWAKDHPPILDVRKPGEFAAEHIDGAYSLPLDYINDKMDTLDSDTVHYAHCLSGYRSVIFNSILKARGVHNFIDIAGGWTALQHTDLPRTDFVCESVVK